MTAEGAKHRSESGRIAVGEAAVDADARICPKNPTPTPGQKEAYRLPRLQRSGAEHHIPDRKGHDQ
jgi:hypothetical protein